MANTTFHANGKLLLSGEYFVLHGAKALALPLRYGQLMTVYPHPENRLVWESYKGADRWFIAIFDDRLNVVDTNDLKRAQVMHQLLSAALKLANKNTTALVGWRLRHQLQFNPDWGWGSSSTLIYNLASWLDIDPFQLSTATLGGSNYDVACAGASSPIYYRLANGKPLVETVAFAPSFAGHLYFGFLGQKQDSRQAVAKVSHRDKPSAALIAHISQLTEQLAFCPDLSTFQQLMAEHEAEVTRYIGIEPVRKRLFPDFNGAVKSLGAWGGDFVMAASSMDAKETLRYFSTKGVAPLFKLHQIALNKA